MEIERSSATSAKKIWKMVRIILLMLRKELSKSRIIISDINLMLKRGKLAGKAIVNLMQLHHHRTAADIAQSISISPQEYEFSCSNSPAFPAFQYLYGKRNNKHRRYLHSDSYKDVTTANAVKRVLEMLNINEIETAVEASPMVHGLPGFGKSPAVEASPMVHGLPGFGKSPAVRQLRVTDSPFPVKDEGGDGKVDAAAEAFIRRFYSNLMQQKTRAAMESPSPYHDMWGR